MIGVQIIVGLYRNLLFEIVFFFFQKIIDVLPDCGRYFIAEKMNGLGPVFCQMIECSVMSRLYPQKI